MTKRIGICAWAMLAVTPVTLALESPAAKAPEAEKPPGERLRVEFRETRQREGAATATRRYTLLLHADAAPASVLVGSMVAMTTSDQGTLTTAFKNTGVEVHVSAKTLPDGAFELDARFEDSTPLGSGGGVTDIRAADNPILRVVKSASRVRVRKGATVPFADAIDPVSGEVVHVEAAVASAAPTPGPAAGAAPSDSLLRGRLVLLRRHGDTTVARRPYSVVLAVAGDEATPAEVFGGSMLPVQTPVQGRPTIALKDVGSGLQITAKRIGDGRFRLDLRFSDGVLSAAEGAPRMEVFESDSQLFVREGETLTVASAVDPRTGDVIEAELNLEGVR
jgi:hypothetical protein